MLSFWGLRGALAGAGWCHRVPFLLAALMLEKAVLGSHRSQAAVPKVLVVAELTAEGALAGGLGHSEILFPGFF